MLQKMQLTSTVAPVHNENPNNTIYNQAPPANVANNVVPKPTNALPSSTRRLSTVANDKPPSVTIQPTVPTTIVSSAKPVPVTNPPPDKKPLVLSPLSSTYIDPLEQSLANLEHDIIIKNEQPLDNINPGIPQIHPVLNNPIANTNMNPNPNLNPPPMLQPSIAMDIKPPPNLVNNMMPVNSIIHGMHASLDHDIPLLPPNTTASNMMHSTNNGFALKHEYEINTNNNGLSSMGGIPMNMSIPSMFDPLPQINNLPIKKEQPLIQPKPIEELTEPIPNINVTDKKTTPPEQRHSQSVSFKPKQEQNIKNASSWSSLAQSSNSPQNPTPVSGNTTSSASNTRQQVMDSFKAFQKQAKEKADREKQRLESLELKRQQKEQAEKERLRVENERRREKEEEDALEKAR